MVDIKKSAILIADPELDFLQKLEKQSKEGKISVETHLVQTGRDAQLLLSDKTKKFSGVFVSPEVYEPHWISVVKCSMMHRPATPVYAIQGDGSAHRLQDLDLKKLGVRDVIKKPVDFKELVKIVSPLVLTFDAEELIRNSRNRAEEIGAEVVAAEVDFMSIRASDFLSGNSSLFDVFVRLTSGRFIKLLQAGDAFTPERIEAYLRKGVEYFYLRRDVQEQFLKYCDHLTSAIIHHKGVSDEVKVTQTLNMGDETLKFLKYQGVNENNLAYASKFVSNIRQLVHAVDVEKKSTMEAFLSNASAYEHGVSVSLLAGVLCTCLEIDMERPVQIVGMAAFFHDIGLVGMPEKFLLEDESSMTPDELKLYRTHGEKGAEELRKLKGFDPAALQAITQHHIRKSAGGGAGGVQVNRVTEIVGICDEFDKILRRLKSSLLSDAEKNKKIQAEMEQKVFPGFGRQVVYAFRSAFFPKAPAAAA